MLRDRYDNTLTTGSQAARDAYVAGTDEFLAAGPGGEAAFREAIAEDPTFALAHVALARQLQMMARGPEAMAALEVAKSLSGGLSERERAHIAIFELMLTGQGAAALAAIQVHALDYPRDAMVMQPAVGVFGLIGFSGQPGREAEQLAFTAALAPHYGDDWWMLGSHAFSQVEAGQTAKAAETIERSLAIHPRNANAAHYKAHIHYEAGETQAGYAYMADWRHDYPKDSLLHCHCSWHVALWALEQGDVDTMWAVVDADVSPGAAWGPPINVMSDTASILFRAALAGVRVPAERWRAVSDYAGQFFPKPGIAFADVHSALAHAMAGNADALEGVIADATGPAGDLVATLGAAFKAMALEQWSEAQAPLARTLSDHYRIGGSRAQRDLIEYALLGCLLKQGETDKARFLLSTRRPLKSDAHAVAGL
ncbi:MAG: tetratricopeptide repeat protein [Pseudomonadota bacterium]